MNIDDKVKFYVDTELYTGIIKGIGSDTVDVLTNIGLITNVPISEILNEK